MKFDTNNHALFSLNYHLVLVVKYRRRVINDVISNRLKEMFKDIGVKYQINPIEWNHDVDHVHVLFKAAPNSLISKFLNAYKSASSRRIRTEFPAEVSKYYWKPYFWSLSYFIGSVSDRTASAVKQYINSQKGDLPDSPTSDS